MEMGNGSSCRQSSKGDLDWPSNSNPCKYSLYVAYYPLKITMNYCRLNCKSIIFDDLQIYTFIIILSTADSKLHKNENHVDTYFIIIIIARKEIQWGLYPPYFFRIYATEGSQDHNTV